MKAQSSLFLFVIVSQVSIAQDDGMTTGIIYGSN